MGIQLRRARESAIGRLNEHLTRAHRAEPLNDAFLSNRFGRKHAGWKLIVQVNGEQFELVILVGDTFPFEPPEIRFNDAAAFLRFPHVDNKGKLCLTNAAATYSPNLVTQTVDFLIEQAHKLISDSLAGRNEEDFIQEFQNYWHCLPAFSNKKFWSLLKPASPTRSVLYHTAKGFTLFGESEDEIKAWLKNFNGGSFPEGFNTKPTVLVWLKEPLSPKRHPKTAHDILTLACSSAHDANALLMAAIPPDTGSLPMIIGFDSKTGPILAGVELSEPKTANRSNPTKQQNSRSFGFRPGHVPERILLPRYFGDGKPALAEVT
jgi:sulfur-carrier protein adenylyltransferase/sulfurtransferase